MDYWGGGRGVGGEVGGWSDWRRLMLWGDGRGWEGIWGGGSGWKLFSLRLGFLSCLSPVRTFLWKTEGILAAIVFFLLIVLGVFSINRLHRVSHAVFNTGLRYFIGTGWGDRARNEILWESSGQEVMVSQILTMVWNSHTVVEVRNQQNASYLTLKPARQEEQRPTRQLLEVLYTGSVWGEGGGEGTSWKRADLKTGGEG